jgi:hypothetical protein
VPFCRKSCCPSEPGGVAGEGSRGRQDHPPVLLVGAEQRRKHGKQRSKRWPSITSIRCPGAVMTGGRSESQGMKEIVLGSCHEQQRDMQNMRTTPVAAAEESARWRAGGAVRGSSTGARRVENHARMAGSTDGGVTSAPRRGRQARPGGDECRGDQVPHPAHRQRTRPRPGVAGGAAQDDPGRRSGPWDQAPLGGITVAQLNGTPGTRRWLSGGGS